MHLQNTADPGRIELAVGRFRYDENVFVNCPFDFQYQRLFEALVFAILDCGFVPRCALEVSDSSEVRIERIMNIIMECRLGIHDISRTELDRSSRLPRFNMPLELGIFLGAKRYGSAIQREKLCLVLDREPFRYQRFCSDIAGQDVQSHKDDPEVIIKVTRNWLRDALENPGILFPSGSRMVKRFERFQHALPVLCDELALDRDELIFNDYATVASEWLKVNSW